MLSYVLSIHGLFFEEDTTLPVCSSSLTSVSSASPRISPCAIISPMFRLSTRSTSVRFARSVLNSCIMSRFVLPTVLRLCFPSPSSASRLSAAWIHFISAIYGKLLSSRCVAFWYSCIRRSYSRRSSAAVRLLIPDTSTLALPSDVGANCPCRESIHATSVSGTVFEYTFSLPA